MGDRVIRISLLVQRGAICRVCGEAFTDGLSGAPRTCRACSARENRKTAADVPPARRQP